MTSEISPAAVNALLEPFLACINDHSGASTSSFEFSAQILASLPKLAAGGTGLSQILLKLAAPNSPSSAFAPVLRFLGPDILTRMGFSTAEKNLFICWTGMKFYVAEAAKAGLRAFTDPSAMRAALASDPAAQQLAFRGPSFNGDGFSDPFHTLTHIFTNLARAQSHGAGGKGLPAGLLLQDLRGDLQATLIVRHGIGRTDEDTVCFLQATLQCISGQRLAFSYQAILDTFRSPFFSDPAAATRAAGVLKNLDGKLMDVCSSLFMRNHKPDGPLSVARMVVNRNADAPIVCFSPIISTIITLSWQMGAGLAMSGFPDQMAFVRKSGSVVLCMAEAQEAASRAINPTGMLEDLVGTEAGTTVANFIKHRLDPLTDMLLWSGDAPFILMLREPTGAPAVARTLLILARLTRRCLNLVLPRIRSPSGRMVNDCVGRITGLTLRLYRYGTITAHDAAIVVAELVKPSSAIPPDVVTGSIGNPAGWVALPSMVHLELSHVACLAARDPAGLLMLRRSLAAIRNPTTGERVNREFASGFVSMMEMDFNIPALWASGVLALGQPTHINQVRRHYTPKRIADLIDSAGKSERPGPHEGTRPRPQSSILLGLAAILQDYTLGPGIEGAGGRCWDIWGRKDVNLGPLLSAIALGPVPHGSMPQGLFRFGTLIYQPYFEILAVIGKTLHLAWRAARGRIRAGLLGPEAVQRVEKLEGWRLQVRANTRRFLFGLLPQAEEEDNVRMMGARDASRVAPLEDLLRELDAVGGAMQNYTAEQLLSAQLQLVRDARATVTPGAGRGRRDSRFSAIIAAN